WHWLSLSKERLAFESDFLTPPDPSSASIRLVDLPENENDIDLWLCILDFRMPDGLTGVCQVMDELMKRKTLHEVQGRTAERFWGTLLSVALNFHYRHGYLLESIWAYAQWLYGKHGKRWPDIYWHSIDHFANRAQQKYLKLWHSRLGPNFGPDATTFELLIKRLLVYNNHTPNETARLRRDKSAKWLYQASSHRNLYDAVIPFLYERGLSNTAAVWRNRLIRNHDLPRSLASRTFLRFLLAYEPKTELTTAETLVRDSKSPRIEGGKEATNGQGQSMRYLMNKVHGQTFGIREKAYNDELGARWFASTWVSLDFVIDSICALGFTSIGPLSLQSLALRETDTEGVIRRINQLEKAGIGLGTSTYATALRNWAAAGNEDMLQRILYSDMHPDVYDDGHLQRHVMREAISTGDWSQYRLLFEARLSLLTQLITEASNQLLMICLEASNRTLTAKIIGAMQDKEIELFPRSVAAISKHITRNVSPARGADNSEAAFYGHMCCQVIGLQFPPSVEALRIVLEKLGRSRSMEDFLKLATKYIDYYHQCDLQHRNTHFHIVDVPPRLRESAAKDGIQVMPHQLDIQHKLHPVQQLFNKKMHAGLIRWTFLQDLVNPHQDPQEMVTPTLPNSLHFTTGIRILALLRRSSVDIDRKDVARIVMYNLAKLTRSGKLRSLCPDSVADLLSPKARKGWILKAARDMCHHAWGERFL
ncbi:hypothetical protein B0T25DRAFT_427458, partial [Lasiosphaeria hispida]